jgi:hypothetical protein
MTVAQAAKQFKVSRIRIYQIMKSKGISPPRRTDKPTKQKPVTITLTITQDTKQGEITKTQTFKAKRLAIELSAEEET